MFVLEKKRTGVLLLILFVTMLSGLLGCSRPQTTANDTSLSSDPERQQQLLALNRSADELYRKTTSGAFMEAREQLNLFGEQASAISFNGLTGIEGVDALTDAIVEAKRLFNAVQIDPDQSVKAAAKLKLAADTLTHPNQPMWLQYYKVLVEDTKKFDTAVAAGKKQEAQAELGRLKDHYGTIRPAVWISRKPEEAEMLDSLLAFFTKYADSGSFQQEVLQSGLTQWKEALDKLFHKNGDRTAYMPVVQPDRPVMWTLTVGSLIIAVLMISAWRMFDSDRNTVRRPRRIDGE